MPEEIKVAAWKYGTIPATAGIPRPFYFDINSWNLGNWDVTTTLSSLGVTETITTFVVASATVLQAVALSQSGQPYNLSAVIVLSG